MTIEGVMTEEGAEVTQILKDRISLQAGFLMNPAKS
jgi:hypothetical protein